MLFDMDGSLFNHDAAVIEAMNQLAHPSETPLNADELYSIDNLPYMKARMDLVRSVPGFWQNLKPIDAGFALWHVAKDLGFECEILTKGPKSKPLAWGEKLLCCQQHLGEDIKVHVVSSKGGFYGKVLYDDYPRYMMDWLNHRPRGLGIMLESPANKDFTHPRVIKYNGDNLAEVKDNLELCLERECGQELSIVPWND
jgi:hypothetical protein